MLLAALTGYGTSDDRRETEAAGFDEHLVKPAEFESLRRLFEHPRLIAAWQQMPGTQNPARSSAE
jgi:CheY-like chemotaxis protein